MIERIFAAIDTTSYRFSAIAILLLSIVMVTEVVFRYIPWFNMAQPWIPGMLRLLDIWLIFLGSIVAMGRNQHLRISFFTEKMPQKMREWNNLVVNLITFCLFLLVIYCSIPIVRSAMDLTFAGVPFSRGYSSIALPICTSVMALIAFRRIVVSIKELRSKNTL
jgi:TRAP-type C4-dicarboxylate transport system permease small subunit